MGEPNQHPCHGQERPVERHPPVPRLENLQRVRPDHRGVVEQYAADPPTDQDSKGDPEHQIVDLALIDRRFGPLPDLRVAHQRHAIAPADDDARDIGQRVPADRKRPELDQHRIDVRKGQVGVSGAGRGSCEASTASRARALDQSAGATSPVSYTADTSIRTLSSPGSTGVGADGLGHGEDARRHRLGADSRRPRTGLTSRATFSPIAEA